MEENRIRLFITVDTNDLGETSTLTPCSQFVYGFDCSQYLTAADVSQDLGSKLIANSSKDKPPSWAVELYLRNQNEYFIPPWSTTKEVFRNGDEVILRLRRVSGYEAGKADVERDTTTSKKRKRKRDLEDEERKRSHEESEKKRDQEEDEKKRSHEEGEKKRTFIEENSAPSDGRTAAVIANDMEVFPAAAPKRKKKRKKKRDDVHLEDQSSISKLPSEEEVKQPREQRNETIDDTPLENSRKKKRRKRTTDSLYDNATVIRDGETGKIRHVYFDSSSTPSPITEGTKADLEKAPADLKGSKAVSEQSKSVLKGSRADSEQCLNGPESGEKLSKAVPEEPFIPKAPPPANKIKKLSSKALANAKEFTAMINEKTTFSTLSESSPISSSSKKDAAIAPMREDSAVPVTIKRLQNHRKIVDENGDGYSNASIIMKKTTNSIPNGTFDEMGSTPPSCDTLSLSNGPSTRSRLSRSASHKSPAIALKASSPQVIAEAAPLLAPVPVMVTSQLSASATSPVNSLVNNSVIQQEFTRPFEEYSLIKHAAGVRVGDRIAYKVIELNELDCTPGVSDWKVGNVVYFNLEDMELRIKLVSGEARCEVPKKFRLLEGDEETGEEEESDKPEPQSLHQQDQKEVINWNEIIQARLIT